MYVTHAASKLSSSAPLVSGMRAAPAPPSGSTISACAAVDTHSPAHRFIKVTGAVVGEGGDDEEDDEALLLLLLLLLLGMMAVPPRVPRDRPSPSWARTSPGRGVAVHGRRGGGAEAAEAERARAAKKPNGDEAGDEADGRRRTEGEHLGGVEDMEQDLCRIIARRTPPEALWTSMVL